MYRKNHRDPVDSSTKEKERTQFSSTVGSSETASTGTSENVIPVEEADDHWCKRLFLFAGTADKLANCSRFWSH